MRYRPLQVALLGWRESRRRSSRPTRPSRRCKATKKTWTRWQPRVLFDQSFWISSSCYLFTRYMNIWCIAQVFLSCHLQVNKWNGTPILLTLGLSPSWLRLRNLYLQQCILFTAKEAVPWRSQWSFATLCFCFPVASRIPNCDQTKMWFLLPTICESLNMAPWLPRKIVAAEWLWSEITWNQPTPLESLVNRSLNHQARKSTTRPYRNIPVRLLLRQPRRPRHPRWQIEPFAWTTVW